MFKKKVKKARRTQKGISLIGLMVAVSIIGILVSVAMVSMSGTTDKARLHSATEKLYSDLVHAQTHAINGENSVYVAFTTGANWCYKLSYNTGCDCTNSSPSCTTGNVVDSNDYNNYTNISLSSSGSDSEINFEPVQGEVASGVTTSPATYTFTNTNNEQAHVLVSETGRISTCSNDLEGYAEC